MYITILRKEESAFCIDGGGALQLPPAAAALTKKERATLVLPYSVSFQIENDSMATPMKAAPFNSGMLFCAPIHSCSFEKISSFSSSFHVDNLLCLLLKACELYTSIMMSIWMYEHQPKPPTAPHATLPITLYTMLYPKKTLLCQRMRKPHCCHPKKRSSTLFFCCSPFDKIQLEYSEIRVMCLFAQLDVGLITNRALWSTLEYSGGEAIWINLLVCIRLMIVLVQLSPQEYFIAYLN